MNDYLKKILNISVPVMLGLLFMTTLFQVGCASSEMVNLRKSIKSMSDTDLVNYYHGLNERIKYISKGTKREDHIGHAQNEGVISNQTLFVGGEGYGLIQKRKLVLNELNKRNLSP